MTPKSIIQTIKSAPSSVVSKEYLTLWNEEEQARIDADIAEHRMADAFATIPGIPSGATVRIEQLTHDFVFGAHIFNFDQLGSDERNDRYKRLYGTLFNSATIPFYWRAFEPDEGHPRFEAGPMDSAEFWNSVEVPEAQPHWRRPATDPLVSFCEERGIRRHGHTLVWGNRRWHVPPWIFEKIPGRYREGITLDPAATSEPPIPAFEALSPTEIARLIPDYAREIHSLMSRRIAEIAARYGDRIQSWDVVNESATDSGRGNIIPDENICASWYGLMPGDYPYRAFQLAEASLPPGTLLNINDYHLGNEDYRNEIRDLVSRGCKIDIVGAQMHIFDPKVCTDIAAGRSDHQSPRHVRTALDRLARAGLPIHMSEITISAPEQGERGELIQAIISRNLYRLWFSLAPVMGITWWNVVDGCGAPGEPSISGLFTRDMQPKAVYYVMNDLICQEWMTRLTLQAGKNGSVNFRGFAGRYRLTWSDADGVTQSLDYHLTKHEGFCPSGVSPT